LIETAAIRQGSMAAIDWLILVLYLAGTLVLGLWLARRNRGEDDYFVAGRSLSGWLAGASMAATTFSIDTPLYVAGLVGTRGLAANWEWWGFGLAHVAMAVVFAPLWRRSGVLTDAAFTELRYGGPAAAWLRGIKAFLLALPVNCIGIGYAFLAMRKVVEALGIVSDQPIPAFGGLSDTVLLLAVVAGLVLTYTAAGGLWAVVVTDFVQLLLALLGALAVAWAAIHAAGGMEALLSSLDALGRPELLSLVPWRWTDAGLDWIGGAGISVSTFLAYLSVQWWSFRRSDGGGVHPAHAGHEGRTAGAPRRLGVLGGQLSRSELALGVGGACRAGASAGPKRLGAQLSRFGGSVLAAGCARPRGRVIGGRFHEHGEHFRELGGQLSHP